MSIILNSDKKDQGDQKRGPKGMDRGSLRQQEGFKKLPQKVKNLRVNG